MKNIRFNNKYYIHLSIILGMFLLITTSCCKDDTPDPDPVSTTGKIHLDFDFKIDGNDIEYGLPKYTNAAGNVYSLYEVQFFISKLTIYQNGNAKELKAWSKEHYVDTNIPTTMSWDVVDDIQEGAYDSLSFVLGFIDADNQSFMFVNKPEVDMIWPEYLGGGFHYLKINGKWEIATDTLRGFAFHLGRGQVRDASGVPISFIDNSFKVTFANSEFSISKNKYTSMTIRMNVDQWFKNPTDYDHNTWGGDIMENQPAMQIAKDNGWNVFELIK
ncbi:MAG: hypothetical protein KAG64_02955 [Bacteroidales bacterium]|nr:hypothetical protein [Bacteroidales bacterium]